jgi:putative ABC transport system permease protein
MHGIIQDLRIAARKLGKAPGFSLTVVLMLAVGIGATTAIFSLVEGVLLRPLPFHEPDRLVLLGEHVGDSPGIGVTAREIAIYSSASRAFSSMGGFSNTTFELSGGRVPEMTYGARLNAGVFPTLGVRPVVGRVFTQAEEDAHQPLAVIGYAMWMNRYHRDPSAVGSTIELNRKTYTIIGVMPRGFEFPLQAGRLGQVQIWVPMSLRPEEVTDEAAGFWGSKIVARLAPGVTVAQASQDAGRVAQQVMRSFPATMAAIHVRGDAALLREELVGDVRPMLRTLFLAVAVVLLLACVNVAILMLVRAIRARREYAVRLAMGASFTAIVRESLVQGLLLGAAGGALGLGLAAAAIRMVVVALPDSMPRIDAIAMDGTVAMFAVLLALATGALCSVAPAFAAVRTNLLDSLKDGVRTGSGAASHAWLRSGLVVVEIAIALVLLTVSGAFVRSYQKMLMVGPGFDPEQVVAASFELPREQYPTWTAANEFNRVVMERLTEKPGIASAGFSMVLPASGGGAMSAYTIEGVPVSAWKLKFAHFATTDGDYFRTLGIPLRDGRYFTAADRADAPLVVIVNESMAKHAWPGQRAVGRRMHAGNPKKGYPWATVVGVVGDTREGARDQPSSDQWYIPFRQPAILYGAAVPDALTAPAGGSFAVRSPLPPERSIQTLRATVAEVDPQLALTDVQAMTEAIANIEAPRRFNTGLISGFALGALLLAVSGIYAVVAFSVSMRGQEIAIRMALGARRTGIARIVLVSSLKLGSLGCALGVAGSLAASRVVSSFLFDVSAMDPWIYGASVAAMLALTLVASVLPATRAASTDPIQALRTV